MISLKEALKLSADEISALRAELKDKILKTKELGAYVEQLTGEALNISGEGVPRQISPLPHSEAIRAARSASRRHFAAA